MRGRSLERSGGVVKMKGPRLGEERGGIAGLGIEGGRFGRVPGARCSRPVRTIGPVTRLHPPAFGGMREHRRQRDFAQEATRARRRLARRRVNQNGFTTTRMHDEDHQDGRYLVDDTIEFLACACSGRRRSRARSGQKAVHARHRQHQQRTWRAASRRSASRPARSSTEPRIQVSDHRRR